MQLYYSTISHEEWDWVCQKWADRVAETIAGTDYIRQLL